MDKNLEAQIADAEERLRLAMLASDVNVLDELLASDLIFTNHLGQLLSKEADLSAHKSGDLNISVLKSSEQKILFLADNAAIVSVRVQVVGEYAGKPAGGDFRFTRVWSRLPNNKWQVMVAHAGMIA